MRNTTVIGRVAAVAAVAIAIVVVAVILLSGGSSYQVKALFQNASQIVSGDQVEVGGSSIGSVSNIQLTPQGQAELTLSISDSKYKPLRQGTLATVRVPSLTSVANRYIDLRLGPGTAPTIPNNGTIGTRYTASAVDLDELFNTLNPQTRQALRAVIKGSATQFNGKTAMAQAALQYLNPAVAASSALFAELNRNTAKFTGFLVNTDHLVTDIAARQSDLSALVGNLNGTTTALANQHVALGQALGRLPGFMRLANTTFVNLRSALDDLTPLVNASKPVAPKLQKLLVQLKPLAEQAVPTVHDLSNVISKPGPDNDLIELVRLGVPLAQATVDTVYANGQRRPGAFPASVAALNQSTPELAIARPYAVDLTGWFEGYSHPGAVDANGNAARVAPVIGAFSATSGGSLLTPIPPILRALNAQKLLSFGQGDRCPGSMERGGLYYPETGYPCNPSEVPTGP